jgi:hypothetical protein
MKRKRREQREERRKDQVELNLLAEEETTRSPLGRARSGCALPFLGGLGILVAIAGVHAVLG